MPHNITMECYICLNVIKRRNKKTLICEHSFCKKCIERWETSAKIQKKLCTSCKYGCIECQPRLETVMHDIEKHMRNHHYDALRDSLNLLEIVKSI